MGRELQKIWNVKVKLIPLVVGSLGAIPKQFGYRLKQIGITVGTAQVQQTVLLGTARILRNKSIETWNKAQTSLGDTILKDLTPNKIKTIVMKKRLIVINYLCCVWEVYISLNTF